MKVIGLFLALTLMMMGAVHAAGAGFQRADTNRDGKVDEKELNTAVANKFMQYDRNGDGVIDSREFNPKRDPQVFREFKFMDKDQNRRIDLDEFKAAASQRFNAFDLDRDNTLSIPEYRSNRAYPILKFYF